MFKNIQNKIIFTHPLVWNIKLIPMLIVLGFIHLISFAFGYFHGTIDLEYSFLLYEYQEFTFFSITSLLLFLIFIYWIFNYMKNNAFENFYPKKAIDIYKEWLLILLIIFLIVGFPISYFYGKESKIRSYITKETLHQETETLKKASLFLKGEYNYLDYKYIKDYSTYEEIPDSLIDENSIQVYRDTIVFNQKKYPYYSLFNKKIGGYQYSDDLTKEDSLIEFQVKIALQNNEKQVIQNIFDDYLLLQAKYKHKNNLTTEKWLNLCYNFPNFEEKIFIGLSKDSEYNDNKYDDYQYNSNDYVEVAPEVDNQNNYKNYDYDSIFKNSVKYYVKGNQTYHQYNHYSNYQLTLKLNEIYWNAYENQECNFGLILFLIYFAGFLSLVLFLYKMLQWKNWLLTLVSGLVISIVTGILAVFIDELIKNHYEELLISALCLIVFILIIIGFIVSIYNNKSKKKSGILLGLTLSIVPVFLLIVFLFTKESVEELSGYNDKKLFTNEIIDIENDFPSVYFFNILEDFILIINIVFVFVMMYFMSVAIKKWKSLAEA